MPASDGDGSAADGRNERGGAGPDDSSSLTVLLQAWGRGDRGARDRLVGEVYGQLRRQASSYLHRERPDHTLRPTALVHEAYLRLGDQRHVRWQNRAQFFGLTAQAMRRVLLDHARRRAAAKRPGGRPRIALEDDLIVEQQADADLMALDDALTELGALDPRQARIVELRFFGGLSVAETAELLAVSATTVKREWTMARAWLYRRIRRE
jgi:RNA polymerase sigma factor (TIGR02999 family)